MLVASTCCLLAGALGGGGQPSTARSELALVAARAPAITDPLGLLAPARVSRVPVPAPAFAAAGAHGRALREACAKPFQLVEAGERCTLPSEGHQLRTCKTPLRCVSGLCKRVREGDFCSNDAMCGGATTNLDLVCVESKCQHLLEAGEACSSPAQCFSRACSKDGKCTGLPEGRDCEYDAVPGKDLAYRNPCAEGLHCALKGTRPNGKQDAKCARHSELGDPCLGFVVPIIPDHAVELPDWFMAAYVSSVYSACAPGHVCEVRGSQTQDATGRGSLSYSGTCRLLLHARAGSECHSDMVCEPPYSCIDSVCAASPAECGARAFKPIDDTPELDEARQASLLSGCATNEACDCPEGIGECIALHDECTAEEQRLVRCMEQHGCAWIDAGESQCAEEHCRDEDVAFECCKYRGPKFEANIDWPAMEHVYGVDVRELCTHIVSGTVQGLPHGGARVVLELNGKDDQIVSADGAFAFSLKLNHLDAYNVSVSSQPHQLGRGKGCIVAHGEGVAIDDVHDVLVNCGDGRARGGGGGDAGGAIAAGILVPCFVLAACAGAAAVAVGRRNGGGAREGAAILARGVRDLPRAWSVPPVNLPTFGRGVRGDGAGAREYFAGSGNDYYDAGAHAADAIPQAVVIDAATGLPAPPVLRASVVS